MRPMLVSKTAVGPVGLGEGGVAGLVCAGLWDWAVGDSGSEDELVLDAAGWV